MLVNESVLQTIYMFCKVNSIVVSTHHGLQIYMMQRSQFRDFHSLSLIYESASSLPCLRLFHSFLGNIISRTFSPFRSSTNRVFIVYSLIYIPILFCIYRMFFLFNFFECSRYASFGGGFIWDQFLR